MPQPHRRFTQEFRDEAVRLHHAVHRVGQRARASAPTMRREPTAVIGWKCTLSPPSANARRRSRSISLRRFRAVCIAGWKKQQVPRLLVLA